MGVIRNLFRGLTFFLSMGGGSATNAAQKLWETIDFADQGGGG